MTHTFLVEIGTEELPPTSLCDLSEAFSDHICSALQKKDIKFEKTRSFATPRRLALMIENLEETTPLRETVVWGPPAKIAFDNQGAPTKAAIAFAKKNGLSVEALSVDNDGKQDKLVCQSRSGGEPTKSLLGDIVRDALTKLPIKKRMRWGSSRVEFVRPVKWLVFMFDDAVVDETILGVASSNKTRGHRFHANCYFEIDRIQNYPDILKSQAKVIADFSQRKSIIEQQVMATAKQLDGKAVIEKSLLEEVTALVEWPSVFAGKFDESFLSVPAEALISSMSEHQKYFHVVDSEGQLKPYFIAVSNIESKDKQQVITGNERVIRPRLADAAFFFETDKKTTLAERRGKLKTLTFQAKLGSVYDKTERIKRLALIIAEQLQVSREAVSLAAELSKSDLVSAMVYEFPDMQGIAGYHYAKHEGLSTDVAQAIAEQYLPKFAGDNVPTGDTGAIIGLADRIDTITGIFAIGERPTGSKDPFALRRASLAILKILLEKSYPLDLKSLVSSSAAALAESAAKVDADEELIADVVDYCIDRFKSWYQEAGVATEVFQSVHAKRLTNPLDINRRVMAVAEFAQYPEAPALAEANKRVSNILAKQDNLDFASRNVNRALFNSEQENILLDQLEMAMKKTSPLLAESRYAEALSALVVLKQPVDNFFDAVMVMADDQSVRENRLTLLSKLREAFLDVADISHLVIKN